MKNRFRHCSDENEATSLLCLYLSSEDEQEEKQALQNEYDAFIFEREMLESDQEDKGSSYRPMYSEDEGSYDYHENIDFKDIPDDPDLDGYPPGMTLSDLIHVGEIEPDDN